MSLPLLISVAVSVLLQDRSVSDADIVAVFHAVCRVQFHLKPHHSVVHATNSHLVQMGDVIESMNRCGIPVSVVEDDEFDNAFRAALNDDVLASVVSPLITYQNSDRNTDEFEIGYDNAFTTKALYRLHVKWPIINEAYLDQLFATLKASGRDLCPELCRADSRYAGLLRHGESARS